MQHKPTDFDPVDVKTKDEIGYYDFMAELGVPYFHWGGITATERLLSLCKISSRKNVLFVGCGTGYSACHIARKYGCKVVGIDISEKMIAKAKERAYRLGLADHVKFQVADAYNLPFEDESFDVVISEFVSVYRIGEYMKANSGLRKTIELITESIYHLLLDSKMRWRLMQAGMMKDILMRNERTRQYLGAMLIVGRKGR